MIESPRVYIAGPYTNGDPVQNVRAAIKAAEEVRAIGCTPFVPHLYHFWHFVDPHPYEYWMALDLEWLRACDVLYRLPGESKGADREVAAMRDLWRSVAYSMAELVEIADALKAGRAVDIKYVSHNRESVA